MIIGVAFSEGEWPMALDISALDLPEIIRSGKVPIYQAVTKRIDTVKTDWTISSMYKTDPPKIRWEPATAIFLGNNIIYDFVLRDLGYTTLRFRPDYCHQTCLWA